MQIYDYCNLLPALISQAKSDGNEKCAVSVGNVKTETERCCCDITDYCFVESVGGISKRFLSTVPKKISYALISLCQKTGQTPIIVHTHPEQKDGASVSFSEQDFRFIERFAALAAKHKINCCLFIVTDGTGMESCLVQTTNMMYSREKGNLYEKLELR